MPPVAIAVAGYAISTSIAAIPLGALAGGAFAGIGLSSATLGAIAGGVFSFAANSAVSGIGKKKGGGTFSNTGAISDQGIKTTLRQSDSTHKIVYGRTRVGGTLAYVETYPTGNGSDGASKTGDNLFLHMIIIHAGHECDAIESVYLDDDLVTLDASGFVNESPYKKDGLSYVRIKHHLGTDTQVADSYLMAEATNWTSDHRLRGLCYSYIRLQWNPDVFQNGIPALNVVLRGKKVYDPRTTLTAWSNNSALCVRDYLTSRDSAGLPYGFGASSAEVDDTFTTAAANVCDETITKLDATTIARYTCNGVVDSAKPPLANLENMLTSMIGNVTTPRSTFRIYAGAYNTPETTVIDESWLTGNIKSRNRVQRQELFNAVRGLYIAPSKSYQSDDFPAITSSTYETEDNGERIYTDIDLPFTTDPEAAQRIAKTVLRKGREQITLSLPVNYKALQFSVWDTVKITNTSRGWTEKVFRITNFTFDIKQGVVMQLREENSASYDWSTSDAEAVANAPDTDLPSPSVVAVPSSVTYNSRAVLTVGGDTVYNLVLLWAAYTNAFVTNGGSFEVQFKKSTDSDWRPSFYVGGDAVSADIPSTSPNIEYDLRIRAVNMLGVRSNWVTINDALIGSSGGVLSTLDWGSVATGATAFNDWDSVASTPTAFNDWGSVV